MACGSLSCMSARIDRPSNERSALPCQDLSSVERTLEASQPARADPQTACSAWHASAVAGLRTCLVLGCQTAAQGYSTVWSDSDLWLLRYMDEQGLVSVKGQVAAHIQSADELVLAELIFQGAFRVRAQLRSRR